MMKRRIHLRNTKRRGGKKYRRFVGWNGRSYWIEMKPEEIRERRLYNLTLVAMPTVSIIVMCAVSGIL